MTRRRPSSASAPTRGRFSRASSSSHCAATISTATASLKLSRKTGRAGAIVSQDWNGNCPQSFALLRVSDTLKAFQDLAARYRKSLPLKVLAITGSNGKTSTKDFTAAVLGRRFRVTKTEGNLNNHIGLPLTMLRGHRQG